MSIQIEAADFELEFFRHCTGKFKVFTPAWPAGGFLGELGEKCYTAKSGVQPPIMSPFPRDYTKMNTVEQFPRKYLEKVIPLYCFVSLNPYLSGLVSKKSHVAKDAKSHYCFSMKLGK
jgi:hypothetical protein